MTKGKSKTTGGEKPKPPKGSMKTAKVTERGIELVVRVENPNDRSLNCITDVRMLRYDSVTKRLTVRLSDEGRTLIPGTVSMRPKFRVIDPNSEVEIKIELPQTIVKLAEAGSPPGEVAFEEQRIAEATEIEVDIGWADTPYYEDPRETDDQRLPTVRWQQDELRVLHKLPSEKGR